LWAKQEDEQERRVPRDRLPRGVELAADALRHTQDHAPREGSPEAAQPSENNRLERGQQSTRPAGRIEVHPHSHEARGDRRGGAGHGHREGGYPGRGQPDQVGGSDIVGGGTDAGAKTRAVQEKIKHRHQRDRREQRHQRKHADVEPRPHLDRRRLQPAAGQGPRVRPEALQQPVLDDDGHAERHQQRQQRVLSRGPLQQEPLQRVKARCGGRQRDQHGQQRMHVQRRADRERQERDQHDQVAVRDVDEAQHADRQRQP
jgi:hypothetical protein